MYRLAIISIESGMCIANPVYREFETCERILEEIINPEEQLYQCPEDITSRFYYINTHVDYNFVIEPVHEEEL